MQATMIPTFRPPMQDFFRTVMKSLSTALRNPLHIHSKRHMSEFLKDFDNKFRILEGELPFRRRQTSAKNSYSMVSNKLT